MRLESAGSILILLYIDPSSLHVSFVHVSCTVSFK